jgi:putative peptide zinc metalloprotease protein
VLVVAARRVVLGLRTGPLPLLSTGRPWRLALYGIASQAYLTLVVFGSVALVWHWADRWQIEWLAIMAAMCVGVGLVAPPVSWIASMLANPGVRRRIRLPRAILGIGLTGAALAGLVMIPLPSRVSAPIVLEVADAEPLYVRVPGVLVEHLPRGTEVHAGDVVARLDNPTLRREVARLSGETAVLAARLEQLEGRRTIDEEAAIRLPGVRESLADASDRFAQRQRDLERLAITTSRSGLVLPPQGIAPTKAGAGRLPVWSGTPMEGRNQGAYLETGTFLGWVGDPQAFEAVALVDEGDVERVVEGQVVALQLALWPGKRLTGRVVEVARRDADAAPPELVESGQLTVRRDRQGAARPLETVYQVRIALDPHDLPLVNRARGDARIHAVARPAGQLFTDWLRRTFRFEE